jgi:ribosomal protein S27E
MSKFYSVECSSCHKKNVVFGNATGVVTCECGQVISKPTGGKADISAKILEVLP